MLTSLKREAVTARASELARLCEVWILLMSLAWRDLRLLCGSFGITGDYDCLRLSEASNAGSG